jgi:Tfp pilus assembly protein PilO
MIPRLIIAILLVAGGFGLLRYLVQPELETVRALRQEQNIVSDTITNAREVIRLQQELQGRLNSISPADIAKIRKFLPAGSALGEFLIDIDTFTKEAGVKVKSISFKESDVAENDSVVSSVKTLTISLGISGTYEEFRELLDMFEQNLRLIDLVSITLKSTDNDILEFDLIVQTYYQERAIL